MSRPDDWNLNVNYLVKTGKDGHTAIRSAIKELEEAGYIQKDISRHANGRIIGVEYILHERPVKSCGNRPAQEQRASFCKGTVLPERPDNEDVEPELITVICDQPMPTPLPSSCSASAILNLIPEKHRNPMVVTFVNKAIVDYQVNEVEEAVAYAAINKNGSR